MGQLIRIILALFALWLVVHYVRRALARHRSSAEPTPDRPAPMLTCAVCGTHVPESEVVRAARQYLLQRGTPPDGRIWLAF